MTDVLPRGARLLARLIPSADREAIVGDLLEDAAVRDLRGPRLAVWLTAECGAIAGGLSLERVRGWLVVPPVGEVVSGLAIDGRGILRDGAASTILRAVIFVGSVATLVLGVELLVSTLMSAAGV
jgi:hypothetical protein